MVRIMGRQGTLIGDSPHDLGLSTDAIRIIPRFIHQDIKVDDFGSEIPAEVMKMMADCQIRMNLVHYDDDLLRFCYQESFGTGLNVGVADGICGPAGRTLGRGWALYTAFNSYIAVNLVPGQGIETPWRFPACYVNAQPLEIPIGAEKTVVTLSWRAIPYVDVSLDSDGNANRGEAVSNGAILWDHTLIT